MLLCPLALSEHSSLAFCFADLKAVYLAVKIYVDKGFNNIWLEVDALLLVDFLQKDKHGNAKNFYLLKDRKILMANLSFKITHIYHEGNACANFLANLGSNSERDFIFGSLDLPFQLRGLVNLDKMHLPFFYFH